MENECFHNCPYFRFSRLSERTVAQHDHSHGNRNVPHAVHQERPSLPSQQHSRVQPVRRVLRDAHEGRPERLSVTLVTDLARCTCYQEGSRSMELAAGAGGMAGGQYPHSPIFSKVPFRQVYTHRHCEEFSALCRISPSFVGREAGSQFMSLNPRPLPLA